MEVKPDSSRGLVEALVDDGRPLLKLTALALIGSGLFAFFLGISGQFLPHDIEFLGTSAEVLKSIADERVAYFMIHDRVSFGGAIIGVGILYLWLIEFPLKAGKAWSWWALLGSGSIGFLSFLAYLGYGYLDSWHGTATLVLLPLFVTGIFRARHLVSPVPSVRVLFSDALPPSFQSKLETGRLLLVITSFCLVLGGLVITTVGMTTVFVPQDLDYICLTISDLEAFNARLIPLIAHDRAGFGGGICCCGFTMFFCALCGTPSRALWQALLFTGIFGFGSAIGVHYPIGYTSFIHLAPAYLGATMFCAGMLLTAQPMLNATDFE